MRSEISSHELSANVRVLSEANTVAAASGFVMDELGAADAAAGAFLASMLRGETRAQSAERCVRAYAHHSWQLVVGHDARFHRRLRFV